MQRERKGFHYRLEREDLIRYAKLTTEERLNWREEVVDLTGAAMTPGARRVLDYFRDEGGKWSTLEREGEDGNDNEEKE